LCELVAMAGTFAMAALRYSEPKPLILFILSTVKLQTEPPDFYYTVSKKHTRHFRL